MTETYTTRVKSWLPRSKPYPNVCACIGTEVGYFHGRFWWHAIGDARIAFEAVVGDILNQLSTVADRYFHIVHFHLYMIGRSRVFATPTIMFFCDEKEPRKRAKGIIDEGGLLERLPGFRTGHQANRPEVGPLVQPATGTIGTYQFVSAISASEVYFDPSFVQPIGMPIFVKHSSGTLRRATANVVFDGLKYVYLSVSHVFFEDILDKPSTTEDSDSEYDFGSGTTSENDDKECMQPTRRASNTFQAKDSYIRSDLRLSERFPSISTNATVPISSVFPAEKSAHTVETTHDYSSTKHGSSNKLATGRTPSVESLEYLGSLVQSSIDQDWALIEITYPGVLDVIQGTKSMVRDIRAHHFLSDGTTDVVAYTSHGSICGRITEGSSYIRLPGSITYQEVYLVELESPLDWGDCGVGVADASTEKIYGHVVASSNTGNIAYIIAAHLVFEAAGIQQDPSEIIAENTHQNQHGLQTIQFSDNQQTSYPPTDAKTQELIASPSASLTQASTPDQIPRWTGLNTEPEIHTEPSSDKPSYAEQPLGLYTSSSTDTISSKQAESSETFPNFRDLQRFNPPSHSREHRSFAKGARTAETSLELKDTERRNIMTPKGYVQVPSQVPVSQLGGASEGVDTIRNRFSQSEKPSFRIDGETFENETSYPRFDNHQRTETARAKAHIEQFDISLCEASDRGDEQMVKLLLENGADVNPEGREYNNPLYVASASGYKQVVKLLLDKGADVNPRNGVNTSPLYAASTSGHEQVVELLLDRGANVNPQGGAYNNPLYAASTGGHERVVELLLNRGANVNPQGGAYNNPLHAASTSGHEQVVKLLRAKGAKTHTHGAPLLSQSNIHDPNHQQFPKRKLQKTFPYQNPSTIRTTAIGYDSQYYPSFPEEVPSAIAYMRAAPKSEEDIE